jgi:erythromycin esterase-like protein
MVDISEIHSAAHILTGAEDDYDPLLELIGDARFVLLGESTHGTEEFYHERAIITRRLIKERGFTAVAIEGDWPDAYRVNRYVCNSTEDTDAKQALSGFERFPTWMWRNTETVDFINWLRTYNDDLLSATPKVGFYGLDLYSMFTSIEEVLKYIKEVDPGALDMAKAHYACFDHFSKNSQFYGYAVSLGGMSESCEGAVVAQLLDLHKQRDKYLAHDGAEASDAFFYAQQNARLVKNAEQYYRNMFNNRVSSWNMRDRHMTEMLENLAHHLSEKSNQLAKIVVWAHNSHLGDKQVALVGFTTHHGYVTAASSWDGVSERKRIRPALHGSYEDIFHKIHQARFMLPIRESDQLKKALSEDRLERAIGVIYAPETERQSHYFYANISQQFDAIIHIDETNALKPLELTTHWIGGEAPETYPVGI